MIFMFWIRSQDYKEFKKITIIAEDLSEASDKADKRAKEYNFHVYNQIK